MTTKNKKTKKVIALLLAILMMTSNAAGTLSVFAEEVTPPSYNQPNEDEGSDMQGTQFYYLNIGETYQLPTDIDSISISDTDAFTLNEEAKLLTVNKLGTGTVVIGYEDGTNKTYEFIVTCKIETVENTIGLLTGNTYQIELNNLPDTYKNKITWESSDTRIATVDSNGLVTAIDTGNVKIEATFFKGEEYEYSKEVNVSITNNFTFDEKNIEIEFDSTKSLAYSTSLDASKISFEIEDESVATLSNGVITSVGPGETKVSAIYDKGGSDEKNLELVL